MMKPRPFLFLVFLSSFVLTLNLPFASAQKEKTQDKKPVSSDESEKAKSEEIEKVEAATAQVKEVLERKKEEIEEVKQEAEKVIAEKEVLKKEAEVKEEAALLAKQELELAQKEAEATKDPEAKRRAKELAKEVERLEKEAAIYQEKLTLAESKAEAAEKKIGASEARIAAMQKELEALRKKRSVLAPWIEKALSSALILILGLGFFFLLKFGIKRFEALVTRKDVIRESAAVLRLRTLLRLFHWIGLIAIFGLVAYMLLENFGVSVAPLLAGAGIVGLAFGFGGQYLIRDIINGIFILLEDQYRLHDVVRIGEHAGLVEEINLRHTKLRDLEGKVIYVPNGEVKTVVNFTKGYAHALLDVGVAYKENVDRVMEVLKQIAKEMREDPYFGRLILEDLEMFGVDDFADSQVTIKCRMKTLPIKQWEVLREFRRRIKNRFDELGIEIPFPHRTLYWGTAQDNDWMKAWAARQESSRLPGASSKNP